MRIIPERLDYLWFLGYGLDDKVPNHSVLSKARKRWGKEVFVSLFSRVVGQCVEAGLVGGHKIHVDASLVDANAALGTVKPLSTELRQAIEQVAREQLQKLEEQDREPSPRKILPAALLGPANRASSPKPIGSFAVPPIRMLASCARAACGVGRAIRVTA